MRHVSQDDNHQRRMHVLSRLIRFASSYMGGTASEAGRGIAEFQARSPQQKLDMITSCSIATPQDEDDHLLWLCLPGKTQVAFDDSQ